MKRIVLVLAVLTVLGGGGWYGYVTWFAHAPVDTGDPAESLFAVRQGELRITLTESGTFKARNAENINSKLQRGATITWLVDEGNAVNPGDELARFDDTAIRRELELLETQLLEARTHHKTAGSDLAIQVEDNDANIARAKLDLDEKQGALSLLQQVTHPGRVQELADTVRTTELDNQRAEERYEKAAKLLPQGFVTEAELKQENVQLIRTKMAYDRALREQKMYSEYTAAQDRRRSEFALTEAERQLDRTRARAESQKEQKEAVLSQRERQVRELEARIEEKRQELANSVIRSPGKGIVIYGAPGRHWEREQIKIGAQVWGGLTLFTLPDLSEMQVILDVHEVDINRIHEGLATATTCETYPGLSIAGRISKIATIANANDWMQSSVKQFAVTVDLEGKNLGIKPGITARTEILIEELANVVYVPVQAVFLDQGRHFCFVKELSEYVERLVEIGLSSDVHVVVKNGLARDERVLLFRPQVYRKLPPAPAAVELNPHDVACGAATGTSDEDATDEKPEETVARDAEASPAAEAVATEAVVADKAVKPAAATALSPAAAGASDKAARAAVAEDASAQVHEAGDHGGAAPATDTPASSGAITPVRAKVP